MKERGFEILLHYAGQRRGRTLPGTLAMISASGKASPCWKPPAKKHRHRVRAEIRAVSKLLLLVLLRGEKLGRGADDRLNVAKCEDTLADPPN